MVMVSGRDDDAPIGAPELPPSTTDFWAHNLRSYWRFLRGVRRVGAPILGAGLLAWLLIHDHTGMSCSYSAQRKVLTVKVNNIEGEIRRDGNQLVVSEPGKAQKFCDGGTPTVHNTDTIHVVFEDFAKVRLWLRNGPLEPGATAERDGASEIEVAGSGQSGEIEVVGLRGTDRWAWGPGREEPGLNLNPGRDGDRDVDVTITGQESFITAAARGGDDRIDACTCAAGAPSGPALPADAAGVVSGDDGDDVLHAPGVAPGELDGGPGDDRIFGGPRSDSIFGGAGDDVIDVRAGMRDEVDCAGGRDRVRADHSDVLRRCERVIYEDVPAASSDTAASTSAGLTDRP